MADLKVIHAYRHLYRGLLHAVQFSKPARYTALTQLRRAFREKGAKYDARGIPRTIRFLAAAARERGLEHRVLKNLIMIAWHREDDAQKNWRSFQIEQRQNLTKKELEEHVQATVYKHYDMTIAMLNKSMGLCLR
ncbi:DUF1763-domain-containing protein [Hypoxylon argillaceum]|nr:DUF1763-domain-containing protein [Hypoxylon argillaceum]KAI1151759.1 DUF1763-domain-containing protein [Nemania diffusa]